MSYTGLFDLTKIGIYSPFLVLLVSLIVFGAGQALATNQNDSPTTWLNTKNYANVGAGGGFDKYDCSLYGNDVDDDGICDNWETNSGPNPGLHINFTSSKLSTRPVHYVYNLTCNPHATYVTNSSDPQNVVDPTGLIVCPSSKQKDIYVEVDWMTGQNPSPKALEDVVTAYLKHGIHLHIQAGEIPPPNGGDPSPSSGDMGIHDCDVVISTSPNGSPGACSTSTTNAESYVSIKQNFFGTAAERSGNTTICPSSALPTSPGNPAVTNANSYNCLTAKRQVFHYATFDNYQWGNIQSGGWSEIMGNDLLVSLGNFHNGVGNIDQQESSLMHELGHNLGLSHGGMPPPTGNEDDDNCKPNYLSIMSYTYEYRSSDICRPLDYSDRNLTSSGLNEKLLNDTIESSDPYPSNNPPPPANTTSGQPSSCPTSGERPIWWSLPSGTVTFGHTGTTEDWNANGISSAHYIQNINKLGITGCNTSMNSTLGSFDDWHYILNGNSAIFAHPLNFRSNPNFYSGIVSGTNDVEVGPDPRYATNETDQNNYLVNLPQNDTTAPVLTPPPNQTVDTSDPSGTTVNYPAVNASDPDDYANTPSCNPPSGSKFPVGPTTVTCSSNDTHGNTGNAIFTVKVNLISNPGPLYTYIIAIVLIIIITVIGIWRP